jgi:TonB-linked SusC/RagA family outer membrane protein
MKIRASVGQTGNAQIGNAEYLALYGSATLDLGNGLVNQVYPSQIANNDLGWEKNTQYNIGFDATLWNGLLNANVDLYYSKTTDMLFDIPVSSVSGLTSSNMNIGSMQNKGIELNLSTRKQIGDFSYEVTGNFSLNRNKVLSLGDEDAPIIKESSYAGGYYITQVGKPVGCYYLMVQDGIFHNQEELDSYPHFDQTLVGDFRFVDTDGDGVLEKDDDRQIVGNYMPDFYYGFGFQLGYKGFDLVANFQGVYGNEILNLERRYLCNMEASSNMMKLALQRFPYGELNRATRKSSGNNGASTSTFHLEDGSYLRLQNVALGYTLPSRISESFKVQKLRVYVSAQNLFTWTNYSGYNPEVSNRTSALTPGEDYGTYPLARTFMVGLNLTF